MTAPPGQCQWESVQEPPEENSKWRRGKHPLVAHTEVSHYRKKRSIAIDPTDLLLALTLAAVQTFFKYNLLQVTVAESII